MRVIEVFCRDPKKQEIGHRLLMAICYTANRWMYCHFEGTKTTVGRPYPKRLGDFTCNYSEGSQYVNSNKTAEVHTSTYVTEVLC